MVSFLRDSVAFCYVVVRIMEMVSTKSAAPAPSMPIEITGVTFASMVVLSSLSLGDVLAVLHTWIMIERLAVKFQRFVRRVAKFVVSKFRERGPS
jgi:hypothetical protein